MVSLDEIRDQLDVTAKGYPLKALACDLKKKESTLRNELNGQEGNKLGFDTAFEILDKTRDLKTLDLMETHFGRVAIEMHGADTPVNMESLSKLAKKSGEAIATLAGALADEVLTAEEKKDCTLVLLNLAQKCQSMIMVLQGE